MSNIKLPAETNGNTPPDACKDIVLLLAKEGFEVVDWLIKDGGVYPVTQKYKDKKFSICVNYREIEFNHEEMEELLICISNAQKPNSKFFDSMKSIIQNLYKNYFINS